VTAVVSFSSVGASAAPGRDHAHAQISSGRLNTAGKTLLHHLRATPVTAPSTGGLRSGHHSRAARAARRAVNSTARARGATETVKGASTAKGPSTAKTKSTVVKNENVAGHPAASFTCQLRINRLTAYEYVYNYGASQTLHLYSAVLVRDKKALTQLSKNDDPLGRVRSDVRKLEHHIRRFRRQMAARSLTMHDFQTTVCSMTAGQRASQWTQIHAQSSKLHEAHASLHFVARTLEDAIVRADHHHPGQSPR
jgi:hypothetical protein